MPDQRGREISREFPTTGAPITVSIPNTDGAMPTTPSASENATCVPALFVAVAATRIYRPIKLDVKANVRVVAPTIGVQLVDGSPVSESQVCQANSMFGDGVPLQVPSVAVKFEPTFNVPEISGRVRLAGPSKLNL